MSELKSTLPQEGTANRGESLSVQSCSQQLSPDCPTNSGGDKFRLNVLNEKNENVDQHKKILCQQIFHKGMYLSRPRSNSFSGQLVDSNTDKGIPSREDTSNDHQIQDQDWTLVQNRKRLRNSPDATIRAQKQSKLNYWLAAPTRTSNSFSELANDPITTEMQTPKPIKPPPIFVDKVSNIQPLTKMLEDITQGDFEIKILPSERVKVQTKSAEAYTTVYKELKKRSTEFFTYQPKEERSFRVVLKHIHPSTDLEEIKSALGDLQHEVRNIWNIKHRQTKQPLNIFYIDLKPQSNNKDIYNLKSILNCKVTFEAPKPKREIPQCTSCQQYGHTKKFCHRQPKCVKCAGNHHTVDCPRKERSDKVKCILCDGNHPANYKGCTVYKELQKIHYPAPYKRKQWKPTAPTEKPHPREKTGHTYAEILQENLPPKTSTDAQNTEAFLYKLNKTMQAIMNQMLTLTKLLTELTSKLAFHSNH